MQAPSPTFLGDGPEGGRQEVQPPLRLLSATIAPHGPEKTLTHIFFFFGFWFLRQRGSKMQINHCVWCSEN